MCRLLGHSRSSWPLTFAGETLAAEPATVGGWRLVAGNSRGLGGVCICENIDRATCQCLHPEKRGRY